MLFPTDFEFTHRVERSYSLFPWVRKYVGKDFSFKQKQKHNLYWNGRTFDHPLLLPKPSYESVSISRDTNILVYLWDSLYSSVEDDVTGTGKES